MPLSLLPTLLLYMLVVGYSPGPANLYSLSCSLKYGHRQSLLMWRGLFCGFSIAITVVVLLLHFVGPVFGEYVHYLKYLGATYMLWLAFNIYRNKGMTDQHEKSCSFFTGFIVQLTNAKMILFDLTVFGTFVLPYSNSLLDLFKVALLLLIAGPGANLVWLLVGSYLRRFYEQHRFLLDVVMSLCLAVCAVFILF